MLQNMEPVFTVAVFDTNDTSTTTGFDSFFDNGATIISSVNLPTDFCGKPGHQGVTGTEADLESSAPEGLPGYVASFCFADFDRWAFATTDFRVARAASMSSSSKINSRSASRMCHST